MNRAALVKLLHMGATRMKMDDAEYRAWLVTRTGKSSSKDLGDIELSKLIDNLRESGILDAPAVKRTAGATGPGRPTRRQLKAVDDYARELGMSGIDDKAIATLCRRVAKIENPRFLDRNGVSALLNALSSMTKRRHGEASNDES
ncbi:hypothetical protein GALL_26120 [mine drainage metagenome]|uniref:Mu-like prophage protein gp16 n=1 Tax=mine drainage metagenome TaxID=410659 RepID=A0A1J5TKT5_9ZZZZ